MKMKNKILRISAVTGTAFTFLAGSANAQAASITSVLGATTSSIGTYLAYLPEALVVAVVAALGLVYLKRKQGGAAQLSGGLGSLGGASSTTGGAGMGGGSVPSATNLMAIYSHQQHRIIGFRPFRVDRKTDPSGNILEKRAVYLDAKIAGKGGSMDRVMDVFKNISVALGRKPKPNQEEGEPEGVLFSESLATGSPSGGWVAAITLEENAQIPIFPEIRSAGEPGKMPKIDVQAYGALADEIKRINEQYDKRISRLKDAALSINQYASNANTQMRQMFGKEMMIFGILLLVGLLVLGYEISNVTTAVTGALHTAAVIRNVTG